MTQIKVENIQKIDDPLDMIEEIVLANGWDYDKAVKKQIKCVYLRSNGRAGIGDSSFGTINPTMNSDLYNK